LGDPPRVFLLSPASAEDHDAFRAACRRMVQAESGDPFEVLNAKVMAIQEKAAGKKGPPMLPDVLKALADSAFSAAAAKGGSGKADPTNDQIIAKSQELEAVRWWVLYRLKKADPSVSAEWVAKAVPDDATAAAVSRRLYAEVDRLGKS
jgi:hypothetical protein